MAKFGFLSHADMSRLSDDTNYRRDSASHLERILAKKSEKVA